jgi:SsrA-binding protein
MDLLVNKKAKFDYFVIDTEIAGISLYGTEVKSIINKKSSFVDSFIYIVNNNVSIKKFIIQQYQMESKYSYHDENRDKTLLLTSKQIEKFRKGCQVVGHSIIPLRVFINEKGKIKIEIALVKGKKQYDKRESIKEKDIKRQNDRNI